MVFDPRFYASSVISQLQDRGLISILLPRSQDRMADTYNPSTVSYSYRITGAGYDVPATTCLQFSVRINPERIAEDLDRRGQGWSCKSVERFTNKVSGDVHERFEMEICHSDSISVVLDEPNRFKISVGVERDPREDGCTTSVLISNDRQQGGTLYHVAVCESISKGEFAAVREHLDGSVALFMTRGLIYEWDPGDTRTVVFRDHVLLPETTLRPALGMDLSQFQRESGASSDVIDLFSRKGWQSLYRFQEEAYGKILRALDANTAPGLGKAVVISVGTAGGKTEAFLGPILDKLSRIAERPGSSAFLFYPTKPLANDQSARVFHYLAELNKKVSPNITMGLLHGDVPKNTAALESATSNDLVRFPFGDCPECGGAGLTSAYHEDAGRHVLRCKDCGCSYPFVYLTEEDVLDFVPDILITNPDKIHASLCRDYPLPFHSLVGREYYICERCGRQSPVTGRIRRGEVACRKKLWPDGQQCGGKLNGPYSGSPIVFVVDELHQFKGSFGSHFAVLLSRMKAIIQGYGRPRPVEIGSSATIQNPDEVARHLFHLAEADIFEAILPNADMYEDETGEATRYHLFLMPSHESVRYAVGNAIEGVIKADADVGEITPVLLFSDSKANVYGLSHSLTEYYANLPLSDDEKRQMVTRTHTGDDPGPARARIEREFDQQRIRVLLATQTLEVGVDFRDLHLLFLLGATFSYNDYVQRVGRAGRGGAPALVICFLRPYVPLDNYYFEKCRELIEFDPRNIESVPIRGDNPYLIDLHLLPTLLDRVLQSEPDGLWFFQPHRARASMLSDEGLAALEAGLGDAYIADWSLDREMTRQMIARRVEQFRARLEEADASSDGFVTAVFRDLLPWFGLRGSEDQGEIQTTDSYRYAEISMYGPSDDEGSEPDDDSDVAGHGEGD